MADLGTVDLLVIGGGVNGAGIARDAAGRGLSVVLTEKDDLAEGTSSRSGKLVHGGLRYLEYYEFRLVREALIEREVSKRGLIHVDGKKEFALGAGRKPVLVDSFGTLDGDRWWDAKSYAEGKIVESNPTEASYWFLKAAENHIIDAQFQIGIRLARGDGVEQNVVDGYMWLLIACDGNHEGAQTVRDKLKLQMNFAQITEAQTRSGKYIAKIPQK